MSSCAESYLPLLYVRCEALFHITPSPHEFELKQSSDYRVPRKENKIQRDHPPGLMIVEPFTLTHGTASHSLKSVILGLSLSTTSRVVPHERESESRYKGCSYAADQSKAFVDHTKVRLTARRTRVGYVSGIASEDPRMSKHEIQT